MATLYSKAALARAHDSPRAVRHAEAMKYEF